MKTLSAVLIGLDVGLIINGAFSIVKYPKQNFPEQFIRIMRATVGVVVNLIALAEY